MFGSDDAPDPLPISALQHLLFCERQCALIHLEGVWAENWRTVQGQHLHAKAHAGPDETRDGVRVVRGLSLWSRRLGLVGKADVVEFHATHDRPAGVGTIAPLGDAIRARLALLDAAESDSPLAPKPAAGLAPPPAAGASPHFGWRVVPVEYKRGKPKSNDCDRVQLCAQAICLEEMLAFPIDAGCLFYGERRRRTDVAFDEPLRTVTTDAARRLHELIASRITPKVDRQKKCDSCSLLNLCLPGATGPGRSAVRFVQRQFAAALRTTESPKDPFV